MTKIAHFADTHLGYRQYGIREREEDFYDSFNKIIDDMIEKNVDYVIHSGDLFEIAKPPIKALFTAQKGFEKLMDNGVKIYVIAGNHDILKQKGSLIPQELYKNDNFNILSTKNHSFKLTDDIFLGGIPYLSNQYEDYMKIFLNEILKDSKKYKFKILMLHGSISKYFNFNPEFNLEVIPEGFDYYALGHLHNRIKEKFKGGILSYPGSTEIRSSEEIKDYQKQGKGYNLITINEDINVEYINIPLKREFIRENIDYVNLDDRLDKLESKIKDLPEKPLVQLTIKNGNFEKSEVSQKIYQKLNQYTLRTKIITDITELTTPPETDSEETVTPVSLIQEYLNEDFGEEISKLGINLYTELSQGNLPMSKKIAENFYEKFFEEDDAS